jgi:autotransporter-associated beta strand protein
LTGTTATAATLANVTDAALNYEYSAAVTTAANLTGNTLRYSGGATTTAIGAANSLTLNGLMQAGTGALTISGGPTTGGILIGSTGELVIAANAQATTISAAIGGTGRLVYTGAGSTLSLSSLSNSYTGGTVINSGTVTLTGTANTDLNAILGAASGGITLNGGQLRVAGANISSAARVVTVNGTGSSIFVNKNNNFTTTGKLTGAGTLSTLDGGGAGTLSVYSFNSTANDFTGRIVGTNTTINVNSFADSANRIVLDGATFNYGTGATAPANFSNRAIELSGTTGGAAITNSNTTAPNTLTFTQSPVVTGIGNKTLTLGGANTGANTFSGIITDGPGSAIALSVNGANWIVSGNNTYTGQTTISGNTGATLTLSGNNFRMSGNVVLSTSTGTVGSAPRLNINSATALGTGTLLFGGGAASDVVRIDNTSTGPLTVSTANPITLNRNFTFVGTQSLSLGTGTATLSGLTTGTNRVITVSANSLSFDGTIAEGVANVGITKQGAGTLLLSGTNTYTGGTVVSAGTLAFANGSLGSTGSVQVVGGTLLWLAGNTQDVSSRFVNTATTATFITNGNNITFASGFGSGVAAAVVKNGLGTLTMSGTNTYTGQTTLTGGGGLTLDYSTNDTSKLADGAALNLSSGRLTLNGGSHREIVSSTVLNFAGGVIARSGGGTASLRLNTITRNANSTISFADATIADTDTSNTNGILGGWATIGNDWAVSATTAADTPITALASYSGALPDTGTGSATSNYTLDGSQSQSSTVAANTVKITNTADSQTLALAANDLTITSTSATALGGIMYAGGNNNVYSITGSTGRIVTSAANQEIIFAVQAGTLSVGAFIGASGSTGSVTKSGSGTLDVSSANNYTGITRVNEGVLRLSNDSAAGTAAGGIVVPVGTALELNGVNIGAEALTLNGYGVSNGGGLRNLAGTTSSYAGAISSSVAGGFRINSDTGGTLNLTGGVVTAQFQDLTIGGAGNTNVTTTPVSGAGGLTKDGSGIVTLAAVNTYTGATSVNGGTLMVSGSLSGTTAVNVNNTGILGGSGGSINSRAVVTVASGGTVAPGASIGTLSTGSVNLASGSTFALEINTTALTTDVLAITGNLSLADADDAILTISDLNSTAITTGAFPFITYTGTWDGDFFTYMGNVIPDGGLLTVGGNYFTLDYDFGGNSVALLAAIPEPNSMVVLAAGAVLLAGLRRSRSKQ